MTEPQIIIVAILIVMVGLFIWGRWRHDFVAVAALLACVLTGLVPSTAAFSGFGHPAVITVAGVLILSGVLQSTGTAAALARTFLPQSAGLVVTMASLSILAAVLSAFMNNVGALALLMPVALQIAARQNFPAGQLLMPLAFGSILGGMTTLIGTPPNLIVSGFRAETGAGTFTMFDFGPVGLAVAGAGILFIVLIGWRLVPVRERAGAEGFETGAYLTEVRVPEKSKTVGMTLQEVEEAMDEADAQIIGLVRDEVRIPAPNPRRKIRADDILMIEAEPDGLTEVLSRLELRLEEDKDRGKDKKDTDDDEEKVSAENKQEKKEEKKREKSVQSEEIVLMEVALLPGSSLAGRSVTDIQLRTRLGINLLAVSREGQNKRARLRSMRLDAGDVLLLQGDRDALSEFSSQFGGVPLADRPLQLPRKRDAILAGAVMAMGVVAAAFGLVPAALSFAGAALLSVLLKLISPRKFYDSIDWPVIVLLGALIPVAQAMATTGTAELIAQALVQDVAKGHAILTLALILVVTMTLSDFMNNAATAAVMCPIAIGIAGALGTSADPFLMAVAIGASCAFLTPIGHQNNTLILGPGGFRFGDYWRMGLPLEILVIAVSVPMILWVWPL
ncbi:MAG TPA: SLC13 family permease [Burkholderiales bacterium]|nr:SLC13 family permease [Burkholderiales bacterium]